MKVINFHPRYGWLAVAAVSFCIACCKDPTNVPSPRFLDDEGCVFAPELPRLPDELHLVAMGRRERELGFVMDDWAGLTREEAIDINDRSREVYDAVLTFMSSFPDPSSIPAQLHSFDESDPDAQLNCFAARYTNANRLLMANIFIHLDRGDSEPAAELATIIATTTNRMLSSHHWDAVVIGYTHAYSLVWNLQEPLKHGLLANVSSNRIQELTIAIDQLFQATLSAEERFEALRFEHDPFLAVLDSLSPDE